MILAANQREMVNEQPLRVHVRGGALRCSQAQVHMLADHARDELIGRTIVDHHLDMRVLHAKSLHHARQQDFTKRGCDRQRVNRLLVVILVSTFVNL